MESGTVTWGEEAGHYLTVIERVVTDPLEEVKGWFPMTPDP